jgi:predicted nucleotidyltransferase
MSRFSPKKVSATEAAALVESKLKWILEGCSPTRVILFGSASRGELTDHSDVDFAVLFESLQALKEGRLKLFSRPRDDDWPQDILCFVEADFLVRVQTGGVCEIIAEEGQVIYQRSST